MGSGRILRAVAAACLVLGAGAVTTTRAEAGDLEALRSRAQQIADEVSALEHRLSSLRVERDRLEIEITDASRAIGIVELQMHETDEALRIARDRFVQRAIEAYKAGPTRQLDILLSARSMSEMMTFARAANDAAALDAQALEELTAKQRAAERLQAGLDERKQRLLSAQARVAAVTDDISVTLNDRSSVLADMTARIEELEAQARRQAAATADPDNALERLLAPGPDGRPSLGIPAGYVATGVRFEGVASWYGPGFEGNSTANGDIFDPRKFTAASLDLPFGTWLYVEHEGRGVVVYINDRGPYVGGRILDLSQAAAEAIGISGLGWIEAEIVIKK